MRNYIALTILFFHFTIYCQQSEIHGVVSIFNSKTRTGKLQLVRGASIEDDFRKAQTVWTNDDGKFTLTYVGVDNNHTVFFKVKYPGLRVVNETDLNGIAGQKDDIRISMAIPDSIDSYKLRIYNIGKTAREKSLEIAIKNKNIQITILKKERVVNIARISVLEDELRQLNEKFKRIDNDAEDLANRYAFIDIDNISPAFKSAFNLFQSGDLDSAQLLLQNQNLSKRVTLVLEEEKKSLIRKAQEDRYDAIINKEKIDLSKALQLNIDLFKLQNKFDSVKTKFQELVRLDPLNPTHIIDYATFLSEINENNLGIIEFKKALEIYQNNKVYSNDNEIVKALILNNLGILFAKKNDVVTAEQYCNESLSIFKKIDQEGIHYPLPFVRSLLTLADIYNEKQDFFQSSVAYFEAIGILHKMVSYNKNLYEPELARAFINLGGMYINKNDYDSSINVLLQANSIYNRLINSSFQFDKAILDYNLGYSYRHINNLIDSRNYFNKSMDIIKKLAKNNLKAYNPFLAKIQDSRANVLMASGFTDSAVTSINESVSIYKELVQEDNSTYEPDLERALNDMGNIFFNKRDDITCERAYKESLDISNRLLMQTGLIQYKVDVAVAEKNLGNLYAFLRKDFDIAKKYYFDSYQIRSELIRVDSTIYGGQLASTAQSLATFYSMQNDFVRAVFYYGQAISIYEFLIKVAPMVYELNLAEAYFNCAQMNCNLVKLFADQNNLTSSINNKNMAKGYFLKARKICFNLYDSNPPMFKDMISMIDENLKSL